MSETILKVEDLKTSFMTSSGEVQAVRGVSFEVHKGEIHLTTAVLTLTS